VGVQAPSQWGPDSPDFVASAPGAETPSYASASPTARQAHRIACTPHRPAVPCLRSRLISEVGVYTEAWPTDRTAPALGPAGHHPPAGCRSVGALSGPAGHLPSTTNTCLLKAASLVKHSNSGKKVSIRFDSDRQSDKFADCTLIFK